MLDRPKARAEALPLYVRAHGRVEVSFGCVGARTVRLASHESGGYRARFPTRFDGRSEAVLINTGGGMTGGDSLDITVKAEAGVRAVVTTQAAEKIYRSDGPDTCFSSRITLAEHATLHWLPQEAILFAGARLTRVLDVEMAATATLIACEAVYFGRAAMGEIFDDAAWRDRWRVRRKGRLIFAEDVRLEGLVHLALQRPAIAAGGRAVATVIVAAPDADSRLDEARAALAGAVSECGASALDSLLICRLMSPDAAALRADLARLMAALTMIPLPRSWQT
jgi:urease accessory protein